MSGPAGRGWCPPIPAVQRLLLGLAALGALASLIDSPYPSLAPLQNLPTLAIVAAVAWGLTRWPLPTPAVACVAAFLMLHTLGGRYLYSYVPYDEWAAALGLPSPNGLLGLTRNSYDRFVHIAFGLLLVCPVEAWLRLHGAVRPGLALCIAVGFVFAGSALYEMFEWLLTVVMAGPDADAYNGQQGDIWDPQKDMACAAAGALCTAVWLRLRQGSRR